MKKKPVLITLGILAVLAIGFFFVRGRYLNKPQKADVAQFINHFTESLAAGQVDSVSACFETNQHQKLIVRLVNIFSGKAGGGGKSDPVFRISLDAGKTKINILNNELAQAVIPVYFTHDSIPGLQSALVLKIRHSSSNIYKIVQIDARTLFGDIIAYEKKVKMKGLRDEDIFSSITLASFKTAKSLMSRYDSVVYFQHVSGKTYYYVVKGKYREYAYDDSVKKADRYKMGLVNPELKEIIPVKYDLVHNISGAIEGLIEVEDGDKRGFYDTDGKNVVPVEYQQIFPLEDDLNLALLRKDDDYFYLKKDFTLSDKLTDFKIGEELKKVKNFGSSFTLKDTESDDLMEYNDRENYTSLIVSPSYMVDLGILPKYIELPNHLRKPIISDDNDGDGEGSEYYKVNFNGYKADGNNWFETAVYSIVDNYLGGRSGLYQSKDILVIDKKSNKITTYDAQAYFPARDGGGEFSGFCNDNVLRQLNDTLYELKATTIVGEKHNGVMVDEVPRYNYLHMVKGKLEAIASNRLFGFTEFVKMDDTYLDGCYVLNGKSTDHITPELLEYMKNEIYASYGFRFKTAKWAREFEYEFGYEDKDKHASVDDSLTDIDKYNINWITQKLKGVKGNTLAAK